jgi:hypothetical protein
MLGVKRLITLFAVAISVSANAAVWNCDKIIDGKKVPDTTGKYMLFSRGSTLELDQSKPVTVVLDGKNDLFNVTRFYPTAKGSFVVWFKLKDYQDWDIVLETHVGFKDKGAKYMSLGFKRKRTGKVQFYNIPGGKSIVTKGNAELYDKRFHQLVITFADGKGAELYIDGKLIGKSPYSSKNTWNRGKFVVGGGWGYKKRPAIFLKRVEYHNRMLKTDEILKSFNKLNEEYNN